MIRVLTSSLIFACIWIPKWIFSVAVYFVSLSNLRLIKFQLRVLDISVQHCLPAMEKWMKLRLKYASKFLAFFSSLFDLNVSAICNCSKQNIAMEIGEVDLVRTGCSCHQTFVASQIAVQIGRPHHFCNEITKQNVNKTEKQHFYVQYKKKEKLHFNFWSPHKFRAVYWIHSC